MSIKQPFLDTSFHQLKLNYFFCGLWRSVLQSLLLSNHPFELVPRRLQKQCFIMSSCACGGFSFYESMLVAGGGRNL